MEPKLVEYDASEHDSLYIDARFKDTPWIWTAEQYDVWFTWIVSFYTGYYNAAPASKTFFVRAVR